ncbi:MAG: hypothetical protein Q8940_07355 [Bacteroidota bacterium]|nr:hypothetical protein [Bacteroidota bacterium]
MASHNENRPGYVLVFTKTIRNKYTGKITHAHEHGLNAFAIWVKEKKN